jgi:phosphatidylserine decarboxylase
MLVSPASGTITKIAKNDTHCFISIFLSPFDIHTQVYPANGTLLHSYYDETGVFNIVTDADKSKFNEKAIHFMLLPDDTVIKFTQIAGFLPRRIVYKGKPGDKVSAGHHMGMIKFGSRVDILFPLKSATDGNFILDKDLKVGKVLELGDHLGHYTSMEGFRFGIAESVYEAEPIIGRDGLYLNALYSNNVKN